MSEISAVWMHFGQQVIEMQAEAIQTLKERIHQDFVQACKILLACSERIVVMGMGKSSYIGGKIAATFASTGSPAFFVHPGEASHGDLGMITAKDVVLVVSNSGETPEILSILPFIKHLKIPLISLTGNPQSTIAQAAEVNLHVGVVKEACPLNLTPTSSATAALVMGDALAITLLQARGFTPVDFARSHPGGQLGKRLLLRVADVMRRDDAIPSVLHTASVAEALVEMSRKGLGMTTIVDSTGKLLGIYTDGDLRRTLDKAIDLRHTPIQEFMTSTPKIIYDTRLAVEALQLMEDYSITSLVVFNVDEQLQGIVHLHDLLRAGVA